MNQISSRRHIELGLGCLSLGRSWGRAADAPPDERTALDLLRVAGELGVRVFDTAPAYGSSERRLGIFLKTLPPELLKECTVATKFGEHWIADSQTTIVDHSYDALMRSIEQSLRLLPRIDLLQLHKATVDVLADAGVARVLEQVKSLGMPFLGVSLSDLETATAAVKDGRFASLQFPYSSMNPSLQPVFAMATQLKLNVFVNRPFATGHLLGGNERAQGKDEKEQAFAAILQQPFSGVILTGTKSVTHLRENVSSFRRALAGFRMNEGAGTQ
jgi:aryl-alcohol dehydrogenase-like predicted oxidoreductase